MAGLKKYLCEHYLIVMFLIRKQRQHNLSDASGPLVDPFLLIETLSESLSGRVGVLQEGKWRKG